MKLQSRRRLGRSAAYVVCVLAFSACGEAEPDVVQLSNKQSHEVSGVVLDGYLEGASVFLDLNGNHEFDGDEPQATTDASGAFHISVRGLSSEQLSAAFLHAIVPDSAKDADDQGSTLKAAGKSGFTLMAPLSAKEAADGGMLAATVVSPLSALVASEMVSGGLDLAEAQAAVQAHLGLTGKDLLQDFVATPDAVLHNIARATAVSLGEASRGQAADAGAGSSHAPGDRVVAALANVKLDLPQIVTALGLHDPAASAGPAAIKLEWTKAQDKHEVLDGGASAHVETGKHHDEPLSFLDAGVQTDRSEHPHDASSAKPPEHVEAKPDAAVGTPTLPTEHHDAGSHEPPPATDDKPSAGTTKPPLNVEPKRELDAGVKPSTELHGDASAPHDAGPAGTDTNRR
ncbi:MAG: hypothetical protein JWN04_3338 [Myxococcaceae bacterium]|nr:hypothetical protein [Myxococcaceae bacterium]